MKNVVLRELITLALGVVGSLMIFSQIFPRGGSVLIALIGTIAVSAGAYIRGRTF